MSNKANLKKHYPTFTTMGMDYDEVNNDWPDTEIVIELDKHEVVNHPTSGEEGNGSSPISTYGKIISSKAANHMIRRHWGIIKEKLNNQIAPNLEKLSNNNESESIVLTQEYKLALDMLLQAADGYVIFSKEIITFLLSQKHCAGIKFYFCINHDEKPSLVLVGVDENECDLGTKPPHCSIVEDPQDLQRTNSINTSTSVNNHSIDESMSSDETIKSISILSKEKTAMVEVGGPNRVSLYKSLDKNDSYSNALKQFFGLSKM